MRHVWRVASCTSPRDVGPVLCGRGVADANRSRVLMAVEPRQLQLWQAPLAPDAVLDVDLVGLAGNGSKQPVAPGSGGGRDCENLEFRGTLNGDGAQ